MPTRPDETSDEPDELSPEWTEYETAWAVASADFDSILEASRFLIRRKSFFRAAQAAGLTKDIFTPFAPNKPGFESRVRNAFEAIIDATNGPTKHAAE